MSSIKTAINRRSLIAFLVLTLFAVLILGQILYLQLVEGEKWKKMSDSLSVSYKDIDAVRGSIYSADGSLLATSLPEYEVHLDMCANPISDEFFADNVDSLAIGLAKVLNEKTVKEYAIMLKKARALKNHYLLLATDVDYITLKELKTLPILRRGRFKGGLIVSQKNRRILPFKGLAERTIGYSANNYYVGLEGAFDNQLAGSRGKRLMQRIAGGVWMPINDEDEVESEDGKDIVSTININMQDIVNEALLKQLVEQDAIYGTAVLMEVKTGEVRAIANLKRINPGRYDEIYNYALGYATEQGSTMKLASFLIALEDKKVNVSDTIDIGKGFTVYDGETMKDAVVLPKKITVREAFENSSNVAISKIITKGYGKDPKLYTSKLEKLGLGKELGLQIPGEAIPKLVTPLDKSWSKTSLPWLSIGYEHTLSPLQVLTLYNAVANGGKMLAPLFVTQIRTVDKIDKQFEAKVLNDKIASAQTIEILQSLLEGVVKNGSAREYKSDILDFAGKTGTAQIADNNLGYKKNLRHQASFCGYFPAKNPQYSLIVVISEPKKSIYGGAVAAPVFREIAEKVYAQEFDVLPSIEQVEDKSTALPLSKKGLVKDASYVYKQLNIPYVSTNEEWATTSNNYINVKFNPVRVSDILVPNVIGMGLADAIYQLENVGLRTIAKGRGKIVYQSIVPNSIVKSKENRVIELELN